MKMGQNGSKTGPKRAKKLPQNQSQQYGKLRYRWKEHQKHDQKRREIYA